MTARGSEVMNTPPVSDYTAKPTTTICEVIKCIDRSRFVSLALIVDDAGKLLNTISDGDVRRGILAGYSLDAHVTDLLEIKRKTPHPQAATAPVGTEPAVLRAMMQKLGVRQMPLVDVQGHVKEVTILRDLLPQPKLPMSAVIMAGGAGKRLLPLTEHLPKPMLPVEGRPLLERIVEKLRDAGIKQINVTTCYMPEKIVEHFGDGATFGVEMTYVNEDRPRGTGGALGLLPVPTETTLVVNGDVMTEVDYNTMLEYHRQHRADMTVGVTQYGLKVPYGVIECEEGGGAVVRRLREKPEMNFLVNAGIYLIEPAAFQFMPKSDAFDMTDLIQFLLAAGKCVVSFPIFEQWLDIGQHTDYARAQRPQELK